MAWLPIEINITHIFIVQMVNFYISYWLQLQDPLIDGKNDQNTRWNLFVLEESCSSKCHMTIVPECLDAMRRVW